MTGLTLATLALSVHIGGYYTHVAMPRTELDKCEAQLASMYEACKSKGHAPSDCNRAATTTLCGLPWALDYGRFLDRRIEEMAAEREYLVKFISLTRLKPTYAVAGWK